MKASPYRRVKPRRISHRKTTDLRAFTSRCRAHTIVAITSPPTARGRSSKISLGKMQEMNIISAYRHRRPGFRMSSVAQSRDRYLVKSIVHSSQLLTAFRSSGEALPLKEIAARSGLPETMAFRLLYTLERCGMVDKVGENFYQSCVRPWKRTNCIGWDMRHRDRTPSFRRKCRPVCSGQLQRRELSSSR
jgi:hypothetical protein